MSRCIEWGRLCSTCRAVVSTCQSVASKYANGASGAVADPWVGVVEDHVERCGCAVGPSMVPTLCRYLEDSRRWSSSFPGVLDATRRHVEQGVDLHLRQWVSSGGLECGVEGCSTVMLDPASACWHLVFTPGLDVAPICSTCVEVGRGVVDPFYWWRGSYLEGVGRD